MAEIKNSFLKSKMNKDLDDRLIPNGEYRDAQNISVGKSEADDIGALETIRGNELVLDFGLSHTDVEVIGYKSIDSRNIIVVYLTNNTDHYIYSYTPGQNNATLLVTGSFLNFSKDSPITGINIIESLLFWTDNRNQPRKINLDLTANGTYYTEENHISVAKYNPYQPISLLKKISKTTTSTSPTSTLLIADTSGIEKGMAVVEYGNAAIEPQDYIYVTNIVANTSVTLSSSVTGVASGDTIHFLSTTMTGEEITFNFNNGSPATWPGDPDFLETKFVRLSYRFEFDDGEYSLMAPFTQIAFIPKQKGYFLEGQEKDSFRSTVVDFMENGVQNIELLIPFPDTLNKVQPSVGASYKIKALDILYKESDSTAVKVVDTIDYDDADEAGNNWTATSTTNIYTYNYQSRKPFRTLPSAQTTRVYDKVPVKALAQESSGNRIIYGNFLDKYSPPAFLNYIVGVGPKSQTIDYYNWVEYPNHSVKQNRNYQVGFVLIDKFGRQSDVVLSQVKTATTTTDGVVYGGDTIYSPYNTSANQGSIRNWFGDALKIDLREPITSVVNSSQGTPGLYAVQIGDGYNTFQSSASDQPTISGNTYVFKLAANQTDIPALNSSLEGEFTDYVKVTNVQVNTPTAGKYTITTDGQVSSNYLQQLPSGPDVKYSYNINSKGWYSYKIVVKQTEQDYYNVYLPGILAGYPGQPLPTSTSENQASNSFYLNLGGGTKDNDLIQVGMVATSDDPAEIVDNPTIVTKKDASNYTFSTTQSIGVDELFFYRMPGDLALFPSDEVGKTANIVLLNDNINKVPRDLVEIGPEQRQFRSSVKLYGRVSNDFIESNRQYYPGINNHLAISISTASDSNFKQETILDQNYQSLYQFDTNPLIARLEVNTELSTIATSSNSPAAGAAQNLTISSAPTVPVEVGMIVTCNGGDSTGIAVGTVYGVVTAIISDTSFTCDLSVGPNGNPSLKFIKTIGSPNGRSRVQDFTLMKPTLAIYETEATESLLDIFWETTSVGLISTLNDAVNTSYEGATGWSSHNSSAFTEAMSGNFLTGLSPVDQLGNNLTNTSSSALTALDGAGNDVSNQFSITRIGGSPPYTYNIAKVGDNFVYNENASLRTYTLSASVTNLANNVVSGPLNINVSLQNVQPVINGGVALSPITNVNQAFTGALTTITGVNGAANATLKLQELKFSISAGNSGNYFSINETTGVLSKINGTSNSVGTHNLTIKLEDANGNASSGSLSATATQQIVVNSSIIGNAFTASDPGVFNQTCNINGAVNATCGTVTYYNQTSLSPSLNDIIRTGPNGASSPLASPGYYSYACGQTGVGNRRFFRIAGNDGKITQVSTC